VVSEGKRFAVRRVVGFLDVTKVRSPCKLGQPFDVRHCQPRGRRHTVVEDPLSEGPEPVGIQDSEGDSRRVNVDEDDNSIGVVFVV
jgi:hypothetical protein